jgi:hypothetical protein
VAGLPEKGSPSGDRLGTAAVPYEGGGGYS